MVRKNNSLVETNPVVVAKYGILSPAVLVITDNSSDWISQFVYDTIDGSVVSKNSTISGVNPPVTDTVVSSLNSPTFRTYFPFDVQTTVSASTMGNQPAEILVQAQHALAVVLQKSIETEFWTGNLAKQLDKDSNGKEINRYLASTAAQDLTPATATTGVKPRYGQAILERALGKTTIGSAGVLHMTRDIASTLKLTNSKGVLTTRLGNTVVAGAGYLGTGPDGTAPAENQAWMYATGPVTVRVGKTVITPDEVSQAVDTSINSMEYFVDCPAAVTWSTSELFAVLVDLTQDLA